MNNFSHRSQITKGSLAESVARFPRLLHLFRRQIFSNFDISYTVFLPPGNMVPKTGKDLTGRRPYMFVRERMVSGIKYTSFVTFPCQSFSWGSVKQYMCQKDDTFSMNAMTVATVTPCKHWFTVHSSFISIFSPERYNVTSRANLVEKVRTCICTRWPNPCRTMHWRYQH